MKLFTHHSQRSCASRYASPSINQSATRPLTHLVTVNPVVTSIHSSHSLRSLSIRLPGLMFQPFRSSPRGMSLSCFLASITAHAGPRPQSRPFLFPAKFPKQARSMERHDLSPVESSQDACFKSAYLLPAWPVLKPSNCYNEAFGASHNFHITTPHPHMAPQYVSAANPSGLVHAKMRRQQLLNESIHRLHHLPRACRPQNQPPSPFRRKHSTQLNPTTTEAQSPPSTSRPFQSLLADLVPRAQSNLYRSTCTTQPSQCVWTCPNNLRDVFFAVGPHSQMRCVCPLLDLKGSLRKYMIIR